MQRQCQVMGHYNNELSVVKTKLVKSINSWSGFQSLEAFEMYILCDRHVRVISTMS